MSTTVTNLLSSKEINEVYAVKPDQSTYEALQLMAAKNVGAVVVMEGDKLLGILTERDYARKIVLFGKTSRYTPVFDTMNRDYPRVAPDTDIVECMKIMTDTHFRYVAIVDGDKFMGLISIGDTVKHIIAQQAANIEHLERYITGL